MGAFATLIKTLTGSKNIGTLADSLGLKLAYLEAVDAGSQPLPDATADAIAVYLGVDRGTVIETVYLSTPLDPNIVPGLLDARPPLSVVGTQYTQGPSPLKATVLPVPITVVPFPTNFLITNAGANIDTNLGVGIVPGV